MKKKIDLRKMKKIKYKFLWDERLFDVYVEEGSSFDN